ncbi:hypothetical protein Tco_1079648 [Tanacetum coccineum]|uniref:Uncharacterized protein n=1 Tax=Tanacetum coccineum TaxID=301880 RepID=A0ABQ5HUH2_9ASTR
MTANRISSDPDRTWVDEILCAIQIALQVTDTVCRLVLVVDLLFLQFLVRCPILLQVSTLDCAGPMVLGLEFHKGQGFIVNVPVAYVTLFLRTVSGGNAIIIRLLDGQLKIGDNAVMPVGIIDDGKRR